MSSRATNGKRSRGDFVPGLGFHALTPLYDTVVGWTVRERSFKQRLRERAAAAPGATALDVGCGTGTLAIELARAVPGVRVLALDADPRMLDRARRKAAANHAQVEFHQGFSTALPLAAASVDVALSSLFFHHLDREAKRATLDELRRVLRPGGRLAVADWGRPQDAVMRALFRGIQWLDGEENTADHAAGRFPEMLLGAGFRHVRVTDRFRTVFGTLELYLAEL